MVKKIGMVGMICVFCLVIVNCGTDETITFPSKLRVEKMLNGLLDSGSGGYKNLDGAMGQWNMGVPDLMAGGAQASAIIKDFDNWRKQGNMTEPITEFKVTGATVLKRTAPPIIKVTGTIEGSPFEMKVIPADPIEWIKPPQ